jgi:hypothetical protein
MAAGRHGSPEITISIDDSGGAPVDLTAFILTINDFSVEALLEAANPFGSAWKFMAASGVKSVGDVTLEGFYNDVGGGPHEVLSGTAAGPNAATRTMTIGWGNAKTSSVEMLIKTYTRTPVNEKLTRFKAVLTPGDADGVTEV